MLNDRPVACQIRGPTDPQGDRCPRRGRMRRRRAAAQAQYLSPMGIVSRPGASAFFVSDGDNFAPRRELLLSPTAPFLPTAEETGERTPAETTFLHFLSALCLFAAARAFPHVTGVFLIVVVPPTVPAQLSAAAACYYGKDYSFCRVAG